MRRVEVRKKNYFTIFIFLVVTFTVLFLSLGFSGFQNKLNISDVSSRVNVDSDIRVTGVSVSGSNLGGFSNYEDYNKSNFNSSLVLPSVDSYVDYAVKITNLGNVELGISSINNNNSNLIYEILDYSIGDKLCNGFECTLGVDTIVTFRVKWNPLYYSNDPIAQNLVLDFSFDTFNDVVVDTSLGLYNLNIPNHVINNGTLFFQVSPDILSSIKILVNDIVIDNYIYSDGILYVPNIIGNVFISNSNVYNISYVGVQNDSYPTVIYGNNASINLGEGNFIISSIMMNGVLLSVSNYTFSNNILNIPNVTGDLIISIGSADSIDYFIGTDEPVVNKTLTVTQLSNFFTSGGFTALSGDGVITHINVSVPYRSSANKNYNVECILSVDGVNVESLVKIINANTSGTLIYDFDTNIVSGQFINIQFNQSGTFSGNQKVTINQETVTFTYK